MYIYIYMDRWMDGWMDEWMDGWMSDGWMYITLCDPLSCLHTCWTPHGRISLVLAQTLAATL